jgi:hypothetical protein
MQPKTASFAPMMLVLKPQSTKLVWSLRKNGEILAACATYFLNSGLMAAVCVSRERKAREAL